jgi:hypothetical protein
MISDQEDLIRLPHNATGTRKRKAASLVPGRYQD